MQQHIYYIRFALRFADMQIPELVTILNAQVQNRVNTRKFPSLAVCSWQGCKTRGLVSYHTVQESL